jgi:methylated-DNA-protein-cysteine methyltransferase-like protein
VLAVVSRIPPGRVATYGDVAKLAGKPLAARAVGNIMSRLTVRGLPAHRVIAAAGRLGGFGGNSGLKRALLAAEGIVVRGDRVREFNERRWPGGRETRPSARRRTAGSGTAAGATPADRSRRLSTRRQRR